MPGILVYTHTEECTQTIEGPFLVDPTGEKTDVLVLMRSSAHLSSSQVAERLGNWASNLKVAGSIPGRAK